MFITKNKCLIASMTPIHDFGVSFKIRIFAI